MSARTTNWMTEREYPLPRGLRALSKGDRVRRCERRQECRPERVRWCNRGQEGDQAEHGTLSELLKQSPKRPSPCPLPASGASEAGGVTSGV